MCVAVGSRVARPRSSIRGTRSSSTCSRFSREGGEEGEQGPAQRAGIQLNDIIVAMDGEPVVDGRAAISWALASRGLGRRMATFYPRARRALISPRSSPCVSASGS